LKIVRPTNTEFEIDGEVNVVLPEEVNEVMASLMVKWEITGRPSSVFSKAGEELMRTIVATWQDLYPTDSQEWLEMRNEYKKNEMSLRDQVKSHSGRSLASIPLYIHKLMDLFFKDDKPKDRKYYQKLVKKFPMFQMANKV
jgi:hypothetical protein